MKALTELLKAAVMSLFATALLISCTATPSTPLPTPPPVPDVPPLCVPVPSAWTVLPPRPDLPPQGVVTGESELNRLSRLDVQAQSLWGWAKRLVEWECGDGPSADLLLPSQAREQAAVVEAYQNRVRKILDPGAPDTFVWDASVAKCTAQPDLADCQFECMSNPNWAWCDEQ